MCGCVDVWMCRWADVRMGWRGGGVWIGAEWWCGCGVAAEIVYKLYTFFGVGGGVVVSLQCDK